MKCVGLHPYFLFVLCFPGLQSTFTIDTTKAGPGTLAVTIEGPSKVKMDCQEAPEGYNVMYTPMAPGNYLIGIKYGGPNHIAGSPFRAKVTGKNNHNHNGWVHIMLKQDFSVMVS